MTTNNRHFINTTKDNKAARDMACVNHSGKMAGMISWSTASSVNPRCQARANCGNKDCICTVCYSEAMQAMYDALGQKLINNTKVLTSEIMPAEALPIINPDRHGRARIEAFGDLVNSTQAINYLNIAAINPGVVFGWWTKNLDILAAAVDSGYKQPENINLIYSNPIMNTRVDINEIRAKYPQLKIKAVFNVWTDEKTAATAGVVINCGGRKCLTCDTGCYNDNDCSEINELVK